MDAICTSSAPTRLTPVVSKQLAAALILAGWLGPALAQGIEAASKGQTVYVPIYSEVRHGNIGSSGRIDSTLLSILVSVRNTDPGTPIRVISASYYSTEGKLLRNSVPTARIIPPFGTLELFVEHRENAGGSGASYAIKWDAPTPASPPMIEAFHSRFQAGFSVAFITRGRAISEP